jgi:hypothetical protein
VQHLHSAFGDAGPVRLVAHRIGWRPTPANGPIVGYLTPDRRAYVAVMHSGVTLAATVYSTLAPAQQEALAPLLLSILLRRATVAADLLPLKTGLQLALDHDTATGPAPVQAAGLLQRARHLAACRTISLSA